MKCKKINIFFIILLVMIVIALLSINLRKNRLKLIENKNITDVINMGNVGDVYFLSQEKKVYKWSGDNLTEINELCGANKIVGTKKEVLYLNDKNEVFVYEINNYIVPIKKFDNILNIYARAGYYVLLKADDEIYISNSKIKNNSFLINGYIKIGFKIKDIICGQHNIVILDYEGNIWLYGPYDEVEEYICGPKIFLRKLKDVNNAEALIGETSSVVYWKDANSNIYAHSIYNFEGEAVEAYFDGLMNYDIARRECNDIDATDFYVGIGNVVVKDNKNNLYFMGNTRIMRGCKCYYVERDYKKIYSSYKNYNFCVIYNGVLILEKDSNKVYLIKYKDI